MGLIESLIILALVLVVLAIVIYAARHAIGAIGLPEPYGTLILVAFGLLVLLVVLYHLWPRL